MCQAMMTVICDPEHVISVAAKYAYYNTGFLLTPEGGLDLQAGRDRLNARSYGSTVQSSNIRPQKSINLDLNSFDAGSAPCHDVSYGFGFRRVNATTRTLWPGNGILSAVDNPTTLFAQVFREGSGTTARRTWISTSATPSPRVAPRSTSASGYDRQGGSALPSVSRGKPAFPGLVPGLNFAGYDAPFTWNNVSPRAVSPMRSTRRARCCACQLQPVFRSAGLASVGYVNRARRPESRLSLARSEHRSFRAADEVPLNQIVAQAVASTPRIRLRSRPRTKSIRTKGAGHAEHRRRARA